MPDVWLLVSSAMMAARQALRAFKYGGARAVGSGYVQVLLVRRAPAAAAAGATAGLGCNVNTITGT